MLGKLGQMLSGGMSGASMGGPVGAVLGAVASVHPDSPISRALGIAGGVQGMGQAIDLKNFGNIKDMLGKLGEGTTTDPTQMGDIENAFQRRLRLNGGQ